MLLLNYLVTMLCKHVHLVMCHDLQPFPWFYMKMNINEIENTGNIGDIDEINMHMTKNW
jgi:hypothetical protein